MQSDPLKRMRKLKAGQKINMVSAGQKINMVSTGQKINMVSAGGTSLPTVPDTWNDFLCECKESPPQRNKYIIFSEPECKSKWSLHLTLFLTFLSAGQAPLGDTPSLPRQKVMSWENKYTFQS